MLLSLLLALACANPPEPAEPTAATAPLPLPAFAVTNHLGEPRGPEHLQGHPTVLWFYPMAGTPG